MRIKHHFPIPRPRPAIIAATLALGAVVAQAAPPPTVPAAVANVPAGHVLAQAAAGKEDIRDIRPPIHFAAPWPWLPTTVAGIALLAAGYGAWRWSRKDGRGMLPYEIALARLEAARPLMHPETAREFSIAVSEVVRDFIEQCFPVRAAHRTTDEFLHELAGANGSVLAAHRESFEDFLQHCDLAKFARWQLSPAQMDAMLASARAFILSIGAPSKVTAPVAEAVLTTS